MPSAFHGAVRVVIRGGERGVSPHPMCRRNPLRTLRQQVQAQMPGGIPSRNNRARHIGNEFSVENVVANPRKEQSRQEPFAGLVGDHHLRGADQVPGVVGKEGERDRERICNCHLDDVAGSIR